MMGLLPNLSCYTETLPEDGRSDEVTLLDCEEPFLLESVVTNVFFFTLSDKGSSFTVMCHNTLNPNMTLAASSRLDMLVFKSWL